MIHCEKCGTRFNVSKWHESRYGMNLCPNCEEEIFNEEFKEEAEDAIERLADIMGINTDKCKEMLWEYL